MKRLFYKIKFLHHEVGIIGLIKIIYEKIIFIFKIPSILLVFKNNKYKIMFHNDGDNFILIPKLSTKKAFLNYRFTNMLYTLNKRSDYEKLLRNLVYKLYENNFIKNDKSIIDIGAWIGDNSLIWSKFLKKTANVYAIDPSKVNLSFIEIIKKHNGIENILCINAVCSDAENINLSFIGSINHATFSKEMVNANNYVKSKTLDSIVSGAEIGLMHLDVEGHEYEVLLGSKKIIEKNLPVIIFEQHTSNKKHKEIINFLRKYNYKIYMINEILLGNNTDCMNLIAFNEGFLEDKFFELIPDNSLLKVI